VGVALGPNLHRTRVPTLRPTLLICRNCPVLKQCLAMALTEKK
jgi:hypothetical protein